MTMKEKLYDILKDGKPHFTREIVDAGLLEYRRRATELRRDGHEIISMKIFDPIKRVKRPGYRMLVPMQDLFSKNSPNSQVSLSLGGK